MITVYATAAVSALSAGQGLQPGIAVNVDDADDYIASLINGGYLIATDDRASGQWDPHT